MNDMTFCNSTWHTQVSLLFVIYFQHQRIQTLLSTVFNSPKTFYLDFIHLIKIIFWTRWFFYHTFYQNYIQIWFFKILMTKGTRIWFLVVLRNIWMSRLPKHMYFWEIGVSWLFFIGFMSNRVLCKDNIFFLFKKNKLVNLFCLMLS